MSAKIIQYQGNSVDATALKGLLNNLILGPDQNSIPVGGKNLAISTKSTSATGTLQDGSALFFEIDTAAVFDATTLVTLTGVSNNKVTANGYLNGAPVQGIYKLRATT